jgi:hypothetical protein
MHTVCRELLVVGMLILLTGCPQKAKESLPYVYPFDDQLRLHHVQVKGTHNSYHLEPEAPVHDSHRYSHLPLEEQLESQGVRTFELDLHYSSSDSPLVVLHLGLVDEQTTCATFVECLTAIKGWSEGNPQHLPIMIWIEMKSGSRDAKTEALSLVETRISSVFSNDQVLTPDLVKGSYASVREALATEGWPMLGQIRGKVTFILLTSDHVTPYLELHPNSEGGLIFPAAALPEFGEPWAAITKYNDPKSLDGIQYALEQNILVASNICGAAMSDEDCETNRKAGLDNGVMMLKDDFPGAVSSRDYWLDIPDGNPARCNSQTAPDFCTSKALENLNY